MNIFEFLETLNNIKNTKNIDKMERIIDKLENNIWRGWLTKAAINAAYKKYNALYNQKQKTRANQKTNTINAAVLY